MKSNKGATTAALTLLITSGMLASALGIRQVNDENNVTAWVVNKNMSAGQTVTVHDVEQKSIDPSNYSNIALSIQNPRALIGQKLATNKMVEQPLFDTDFIRAKSQKVSPSIIKNSISALSSRFPPTWRLHVQPMNKIVRPQITKYSLIRLGLISFCVFAFVYYFLRLPRRLHNEIKQKNQLILNREELFSSSLDALPHGFAIFNSHEFPVITNNAFNLLFAQVNKQNSQLSYSQLVSIAQQNNIINHYHEHHKLDDDRNQLIDIGFTDGKWITVLQRHTDFNGFVCYFRDDTEAHQKECLLADVLEKSKQTNQLKEKFVTRLSRQLKTPLSSLKSLVQISKDPISFNEFKNNVGNISDACDQLESVIQQPVNINKSEIGKLKLQAKNVNLNHMINNNISILTKEAENKKIVLKNNITPGLTVVSDEKLISQLVIQLVTEVLDSSNNTTLSINAQIKNESNRNYLHLDFSLSNLIDSSYFITELKSISGDDIMRFIDDKDVSLELKFFISIFKMLGGKAITVSSNANKSTITLSMLVNKATKQDKDNVQKVPSSSLNTDLVKASLVTKNHQNTLLLVDDDPLVEIVIRAMLKDQNIIIDYACSAIEAMLMVPQNSYDIILMDIVMPELSGTDAMLKIKKHSDNSKTKIIAHTSTPDTESKYVNQGFDDMLLKPVKQGVLINQITRILKR
ncbi:response regulator [Pseudoalteromonas sp. EB27]|uniref:ATP-binding response regulator n=1 Tax=Pseudoalteromonas sp. EB27 TaxID=1938368 RepID=UPI00209B4785|nr:response regulator [Pseudoalteromonas sp. EB27]